MGFWNVPGGILPRFLRLDPVNPTFISGWDPTCASGIPPFPPEIPDGIEGIPCKPGCPFTWVYVSSTLKSGLWLFGMNLLHGAQVQAGVLKSFA